MTIRNEEVRHETKTGVSSGAGQIIGLFEPREMRPFSRSLDGGGRAEQQLKIVPHIDHE